MDFVVRAPYSTELEGRIESKAGNRQELSEIRDEFYKPEGTDLPDFGPRDVIVRKRTFPERETLVRINIMDQPLGYTDTKEEVESLENYEKWGEFTSFAVEYDLEVEGKEVSVLVEEFSFGKYVKMEAPSMELLRDVIEELGLEEDDVIEKNSSELLAEDMGLI